MRLAGKVALITGAGSGIGRATALLFAEEGARVVVADYSPEGGAETVKQVKAQGGDATFVQVDVTKAAEVEAMVKTAVGVYGQLNILHSNAGIFPIEGPSHEMEEDNSTIETEESTDNESNEEEREDNNASSTTEPEEDNSTTKEETENNTVNTPPVIDIS